jgi:predicted dehydrogenase
MARIKYAQIGVGHAHANKISAYRQSDEFEIVAIAEPDEQLQQTAMKSKTYRDLKWISVDELLNSDVQVVGVETRVRDSLDTALKCVEAGKHIHLDKPGGESLKGFKQLVDTAASKHLVIQMGYMYRYNPAIVLLRDALRRGWLGEPFEVHAVMSKKIGNPARNNLSRYAGGTMFELGCHLIDLVIGILGKPQDIHAFPRHSSAVNDSLKDNMLAVFEYEKSTATIRTSVNEVDGFERRHLVVCGSEGTFHIQPLDNPTARVTFSKQRGKYQAGYQDVAFDGYQRYVEDVKDLAKIVRHEKDDDFSYQHDLDVFESILRASDLPTGQ